MVAIALQLSVGAGTNKDNMPILLETKRSRSCHNMAAPLSFNRIEELFSRLKTEWQVIGGKKLRQVFEYPNFAESMVFVNDVAALSEEFEHYPDINVSCGLVTIELSTQGIGALSEKDFILASQIEYVI